MISQSLRRAGRQIRRFLITAATPFLGMTASRTLSHAAAESSYDESETRLLEQVRQIVEPYSCTVIGLAPNAVNVQGDARTYLPSVMVQFPYGMEWETLGIISSRITNNVRVSRVLLNIAPVAAQLPITEQHY